jgi:hypothetical protein
MLYSNPVKQLISNNVANESNAECPTKDDHQLPTTPENARLKGMVWPGMNLFDAATTEVRRKRNQKKDVSVLIAMERASAMVEPTEVIFSPSGTIRKERHIDGMVDDGSPLNGETLIPRPRVRSKRLPLTTISSNVPRLTKHSAKATRTTMSDVFQDPKPIIQHHLQFIPSSSTDAPFEATSRFSPTEDEDMEFKLTVGSLTNRERAGNFTIFNDNSLKSSQSMLPPMKSEAFQPPRFGQEHLVPARPQLSYLTAPWLPTQYQSPLYYNNGSMANRSSGAPLKSYEDIGLGKENVEWTTAHADYGISTANRLGYHYPRTGIHNGVVHHMTSVNAQQPAFDNPVSQFGDPFAYARNPLSIAFGQFDNLLVPSSEVKQRTTSPDGTISEHEEEH